MRRGKVNERTRNPQPLIPSRLPSGRGAMEQPNNTDDVAELSVRFWIALVLTAFAAGALGALMMWILNAVQHLAYGYQEGTFNEAVERASTLRRLLAPMIGGAVVGVLWWWLRRKTVGASDVDDAVWNGTGEVAMPRAFGTSVLSEVSVGVGASLGREAAPKLLGAASGSLLSLWLGLNEGQRRLLVACGAGAGMGAVYNVPVGGALVTAELLLGRLVLPVIIPALVCSAVATSVSWAYLPRVATYDGLPTFAVHPSQIAFAVIVGPLIGVIGVALVRLIGWTSHRQLGGRWVLVAPMIAFTAVGAIGLQYPLLLGNGKDLIHLAFLGTLGGGLATLLLLAFLKPLLTALCLGSGASGGLFTPVMSTGALLGLALGKLWIEVWPGPTAASLAIIIAAAMIGAAMQAPLAAVVLVVELTGTSNAIIVPMVIATAIATGVTRRLDGYSIYSARLPARRDQEPVDALHS